MRQLLMAALFFFTVASGTHAEVTLTFIRTILVRMGWASHFPTLM